MKWKDVDKDMLSNVVNRSVSKTEILIILGFYTNSYNYRKLNHYIDEYMVAKLQ